MSGKQIAYLLILLLFSAQVDDVWVVVPHPAAETLAEENNEYLSGQRQEKRRCQSLDNPKFTGPTVLPGQRDPVNPSGALAVDKECPRPLCPPPLYVFMSLQR